LKLSAGFLSAGDATTALGHLADVARQAGVSQTAASFVLSGRSRDMRISAEVEDRVLRAVRETGYRPNIVSRSLRTGTTHTIALVSDAVSTTPFAGHLIWGAIDAAREQGRLLFIAETEGDPELEQQLIEAMHDRRVNGIVLASMYTRKVTPPKALLDGPAVLLNALPARRAAISTDRRKPGIHRVPMPLRQRSSVRNLTCPQPKEEATVTA
jgi:LacI family transcriptional regulator